MVYVACDPLAGDAAVGDPDELAELRWSSPADMLAMVPHASLALCRSTWIQSCRSRWHFRCAPRTSTGAGRARSC